jgi:Ulp1 family protease
VTHTRRGARGNDIPSYLDRHDLASLEPGRWVNDAVIKAFLAHLLRNGQVTQMALDTLFYPQLVAGELARDEATWGPVLAQAARRQELYVPVTHDGHWSLVVLFRSETLIECYDSRSGGADDDDELAARPDAILRNVRDSLPRLLGWEAASEWETRRVVCAKHTGDTDSGVFMLWFAQRVLAEQDVRVPPPADFRAMIRDTLRPLVVDRQEP